MKAAVILLAAMALVAQPGPTHPRASDLRASSPAPAKMFPHRSPAQPRIRASIARPSVTSDATGLAVWIRLATAPPGTARGSKVTEAITATGAQVVELAHSIITGSERVYKNGIRIASGGDYQVVPFPGSSGLEFTSGQTISAGDTILVEYRWHDPSAGQPERQPRTPLGNLSPPGLCSFAGNRLSFGGRECRRARRATLRATKLPERHNCGVLATLLLRYIEAAILA